MLRSIFPLLLLSLCIFTRVESSGEDGDLNIRAVSQASPFLLALQDTPRAAVELQLKVQKADCYKCFLIVELQESDPLQTDWVTVGDSWLLQLSNEEPLTDQLEEWDLVEEKLYDKKTKLHFLFTTNSTTPVAFDYHVTQLGIVGRWQVVIAGVLLITVYILIVFELMHRTTAALIGAAVTLVVLTILRERPSIATVVTWIDEGTIGLLLGMMIIIGIFSTTGFFEWGAIKCFKATKGKVWRLLIVLCSLTGILSAFLDNVTTIMLVAPVTLRLARVVDLPPIPIILSEVFFSNIGGTATLIGDPPNIIIGSMLSKYIQFIDFIIYLAPGLIIGVIPVFLFLRFAYRNQLQDKIVEDIGELEAQYRITNTRLFMKVLLVLAITIIFFFLEPLTHIEPAWISMTGAAILLMISSPHEIEQFLEKVEWSTLLFFSGLFIFIEALKEMGLIRFIGDVCTSIIGSVKTEEERLIVAVVLIMWVSAFASAFIDNIPYTATMVPVIVLLSEDPELNLPLRALAWSLAFGACLGGNGTLIGASANVVAVGIMDRANYKVSFLTFMKYGMPVMIITVAFACAYAILRFVKFKDY
eukprot:TRINITY_DN3886_c0_g2_i1.p1 TRINITY_DN3886_c0_g2~~TRINITY_DN3886_c0_g2_i1.p1  ORF type:complete len:586 (-),score=77.05 TRINITY_DN3886_c0_g2_i1:26-1783(-)